MPLRVDGVVIPFLIALTMIGALAGVLRWTFGGRPGLRARGAQADSTSSSDDAGRTPEPPLTSARTTPPPVIPPSVIPPPVIPPSVSAGAVPDTPEGADTRDTRRRGAPDTPNTPTAAPDDFGLLATVAVVATVHEADQILARLRAAGIRATTAPGPQGRYRVLVFESEAHRARRLAGPTT